MSYENLILTKEEHIGIITINHPPANAFNFATLNDFDQALDDLENDKEIRAVVVTGAGEKGFSAGFDVSDAAHLEECGPKGSALWTRVERFPKPVIAAINGFAFGGGCELALACHFRIMIDAPKAKIGLTELNLGIIPGWGGTQRMTRVVGKAKALDLILFSKRLSAPEAMEIGLIDKISLPGEAVNDAMDFAGKLSERPPLAVGCVLKAITAYLDNGIDEGLRVEQEGIQSIRNSKDAQEGFTAFFEKRKPVFTGE